MIAGSPNPEECTREGTIMSQTLTISDQLLARLEAAARRHGLKSVEQLLEAWQASDEQHSTELQVPARLPQVADRTLDDRRPADERTEESLRCSQRQNLEERFRHLAAEWRREVGPLSSVSKIIHHPAYQAIIALGPPVVPLILRELERQPDHWFAALRAVTGADPIAAEDRGRMEKMAVAWVRWGREHGLSW
jgi:hypothetical protein